MLHSYSATRRRERRVARAALSSRVLSALEQVAQLIGAGHARQRRQLQNALDRLDHRAVIIAHAAGVVRLHARPDRYKWHLERAAAFVPRNENHAGIVLG